LARLQFPIHFMDEAATSSLQSAVVGMVRGNAVLVLLGDHKQLPPFTHLPDKTLDLENKSFFEELINKGVESASE
jgi:superfamily I DNA and/or RNA helicase